MLAFLAVLVYILVPVRAWFSDDFEILSPTRGQGYSRDERVTVAWTSTIDYYGSISIDLTITNPAAVATTMIIEWPATEGGLDIPPSLLPYVGPSETAFMHLWVYTTYIVSSQTIHDLSGIRDLSITGPTSATPTTLNHTETVTPTPTSTSISDDDSEPTETEPYYPPINGQVFGDNDQVSVEDGGGLSSGAKAGIGAGVAVGTVLLVVGAILLHRRHKTRNPPKTIREITSGPSQAEL
ncbi:hypothetical protein BJX65DRAFT_312606 [Aspergillus insuetus]